MFRKKLVLIVILFAPLWFSKAHGQEILCDKYWVGGERGNWEEPSNWSPWGEPNGNDSVCISDASVLVSENDLIGSLTTDGEVELERGQWWNPTIAILSGLTNHGDLAIRIDIRGDITNIAGAALELGEHINIFGNLYNNAGATITVFPDDIDVHEGEVHNSGLIRAHFGGMIGEDRYFDNSGEIELFNGSCHGIIFDNNSSAVITGTGLINGDQLLQNKGTICASFGGDLLVYSGGSVKNIGTLKNNAGTTLNVHAPTDANNKGTIETNAGGAMTFDCNLSNEPNGIIKLLGGTLAATKITQKAGAKFEGDGKISGNLILQTNAHAAFTGPTEIYGELQIDANAVLDVNDGTTLIKGHCTCNNGTIRMNGGALIPQGGLTNNNCNIVWQPGTYTNIADFNLDGKVNLKDFAYFADTWLWQTAWR